jgi:cytochrome c5
MNETLFYVLGIVLVVVALVVSAIGLRFERFPASKGVLALGIGIIVVLVGATATFAWIQAEDEQEHRDEEIAAGEVPSVADVVEAEAAGESVGEAEEQEPAGEPEGPGGAGQQPGGAQQGGGQEGGGGQPSQAVLAEGEQLFDDQGCASCHSLQAVGATGEVGPNLDEALQGQPPSFIETSIVDPQAEIAEGYEDLMPATFGQSLSQEQIDALVQFLVQSTQ